MSRFLKILFILLPSLGGAGGGLYAQKQGQPFIDSLLKELPKAKEDTNKVNLLTAISYTYSNINPDEGLKYGQQSLALSTKLDWKKGTGDANNRMGVNFANKSDYPKALEYYQKAVKMFEEIGYKKGIASVTQNIGIVYMLQSDYPKALEYDFKALKMNEEMGNKKILQELTGISVGCITTKAIIPKHWNIILKP